MGKHSKVLPRRKSAPKFVVGATLLATAAVIAEPMIARADTGDVDWNAIARCESGGNPRTNTGNGFYGMYQFTLSTWRANGGQGMPQDASPAEQTRVAENVRRSQGLGAWPVCGRHAYDGGARQVVPTVSKPVAESKHAMPAPVMPRPPVEVVRPDVLMGPELFPGGMTYTTSANDCLSSIADAQHVSGGWQRLAELNGITGPDYMIYPGQVLNIE